MIQIMIRQCALGETYSMKKSFGLIKLENENNSSSLKLLAQIHESGLILQVYSMHIETS